MRQGEAVFVDSGAWISLALSRDPLHAQAREQWDILRGTGAKLHTCKNVERDIGDAHGLFPPAKLYAYRSRPHAVL